MPKSRHRKPKRGKARRGKIETSPKTTTSPAAPSAPLAQDSHENETNDHAHQETHNDAASEGASKRGRAMSAWVFAIASIICGLAFTVGIGLWLKGGYENIRLGFYGIVVAGATFAVAFPSAYWYYVVKPAKAAVTATEPFTISVSAGLSASQRALNTAAAWYNWYRSPLGKTLSPIHRLMAIRITNRQTVRSQIETYRVEALTEDGRWVQLTWMDGQRGDVYWIVGNPKNATLLNVPKLDTVLSDRIISPNETIEGWAFFELPENIPNNQPLRIYVKDFGGAETTQVIPHQPTGFAQASDIRPYGNRDLSDTTLRYYSEVPR